MMPPKNYLMLLPFAAVAILATVMVTMPNNDVAGIAGMAPAAGDAVEGDAAGDVMVEEAPAAEEGEPVMGEPGASEGFAPAAEANAPAPAEETPECPYQDMVGKTMSEVDLESIDQPTRVLYPDSAATMDYNPERINFILEKDTDIITEVRCG